MNLQKSKQTIREIDYPKTFLISLLGIVATIICGLNPVVREGYELLFLLPLSFSIARILFQKAFSYWKDSIALVLVFASVYIRYLITPLVMSVSGTCISTVTAQPQYYRLAVFVQIYELFVVLIAISFIWGKYRRKKTSDLSGTLIREKPAEFKLTFLGVVFVLLLALLVFSRGHISNVFSHFSTWWYISEDTTDLYYYDLMAIEVCKSIIAITLISALSKSYHKSNSTFIKGILFSLALSVGIVVTMFYQYTQRTALAQLFLSVMIMLISFFPNKRRLLLVVFGVGGIAFVLYIFATGSMQFEFGGKNDNFLEKTSKMAELYVSGPSVIAVTQERYDLIRSNMSLETYFSDLINSTHIFGLFPVLRGIVNLVAGIPTTNQLFVASLGGLTYILPNYSLWTYYSSSLLGWLFEAFAIMIAVKIMCFVDSRKYVYNDAFFYYGMAYTEILLGQSFFVNNTFLFWHAFTNLPFWLLMFWYINGLGNRMARRLKQRG
ncbi:MAG: hypothetical protein IJR89_06960 [Clostridia bacterium]|nr:hypothetical protein [Clostridia bacterium]